MGARRVSSWGIRMELLQIAMRASSHQGEGSLHLAHADGPPCDAQNSSFHPGRNSIRPTFHLLRIFHIQNFVRRRFTFSGYLTSGWERRTFQLPRSDMSGSFDSAYPESFSLSIQCNGISPEAS
uniref:Uncharacterized protein n=1 Tax=Vitis vinifera TaxID=29760 RepID=A5B3Y1_VITVI|nr:hypothetical protein VITISV_016040 [Vitis vinifera]